MIRTLSKYGPINGANAPAVESINANSGIERDQSDSDSVSGLFFSDFY